MIERGLGHLPDLPDVRDELHAFDRLNLARMALPAVIDEMLPHYHQQDQRSTNSCTGQAARQALRIWQLANLGQLEIDPSALGGYTLGRSYHPGLMSVDAGGYIRSVFRSFSDFGIIGNETWPFDLRNVNETPGKIALTTAFKSRQGRYRRHFKSGDNLLDDLQLSLLNRRPFVCGLPVYRSFLASAGTEYIVAPKPGDEPVGWHALAFFGSKRDAEGLWFRTGNSWGDWRAGGCAWIHFSYMLLGLDKWSVELVENER